jgi:NADPH:quinone reductase-like Zn-dependent oxidoreductase
VGLPQQRPQDAGEGAVGVADATEEGRMRAIVQRCYGSPEVLESADVDRPAVGDDDVLVRVRAASVHPGDYFIMTGEPYVVRLAFGLRRPRHPIPGRDLAGVVAAVGKDVADLQPGDEVFGWSTTGTLAEYACVPADQLVRTPANLSAGQAAAVPTSGLTALQALRDIAHVKPGQAVLITGASGGVGTFAVQIAKALGAEVTGVCSTRNMELVRSAGADHVIDYTRTDFTRTGLRYDVIFDSVEAQSLSEVRRALSPTGTLIPNSGRGGLWVGPLGRIVKARARSLFTRQTLRPFTSVGKRQDLLDLAELLEAAQLAPVIDGTYPLSEAAQALRYVGAGHTRGKVVVTV